MPPASGDVILASTFWLINEPEKKRWFGITPFLWLPVGNYNRNQVLNTGENRWKGALQLGYIQHFADRWALDLYGDTTFYGDNDSFGRDRSTLRQDNSYQFQTWLRYYITPAWNVAPGYSGTWGGKVEVGGNQNFNLLSTEVQQLRLATQYNYHARSAVRGPGADRRMERRWIQELPRPALPRHEGVLSLLSVLRRGIRLREMSWSSASPRVGWRCAPARLGDVPGRGE